MPVTETPTSHQIASGRVPLRILWQNEHYPDVVLGGGGAVNTYYIARALQSFGHEVLVLARDPESVAVRREHYRETEVLRVPRLPLPPNLWPIWPLLELRALGRVLRPLANPFEAFICVDAAYALALKRLFPDRPLLYRTEGTSRGYRAAVTELRPPRQPGLPGIKHSSLNRLLALQVELLERLAWRRCDGIVVKSSFMRDDLVSFYRVPPRRIHVIPNGVDLDRFAPSGLRPSVRAKLGNEHGDRLVILYVGRLVPMKNLRHLLLAFARMTHRDKAILAIVGDGSERESLRAHASELGIANHTRFVGHVPDVESYLSAGDIFALPSTYEPFGNALVEAMAAGLACVALRPDFVTIRTASAEIIEHGKTGILVDGHRAEALADALDALVVDAAWRRALGEAARRACQERYSWTRCAAHYLSLIHSHTRLRGRRP